MNESKELNFNSLGDGDFSHTLVWTSLLMRDEDLKEMDEWFHEIKLIREQDHLVDWKHISGNVLGDQGRSDTLLIFNQDVEFNPMVRLQLGREVKWTDDFFCNFREDYIQ